MKENLFPNDEKSVSVNHHPLDISPFSRVHKGRTFGAEKLAETLAEIEKHLSQGFAAEVEERSFQILENYRIPLEVQARLNCFISQAFAMQGRFNEALEVLKPFESKDITGVFQIEQVETYAILLLEQGIAYANLNDSSKAISLLTLSQRIAEERDYIYLLVKIHTTFARVYRDSGEFSVSRSYVDKAVRCSLRVGDWRGNAEAQQVGATGYYQEGKTAEAVEHFQKAIQLIGTRPAPFLLGKIYSDISVVYWVLSRPAEGIESAKKALGLLEKTGNKYQTAIADNNLGINLLLSGDWQKAEQVLTRAIDSALEIEHSHLASFICSMGELNLLREDYEEAEALLNQSLTLSQNQEKKWFSVQILHFLTKCLLAQNKTSSAIAKAQETIRLCEKINENHYKQLTAFLLAESYFKLKKVSEAEDVLFAIEESRTENPVLQGNVARLRGMMALENSDRELAVHHFNRSLTIFETTGDLYHTALARQKLGAILVKSQPAQAKELLTAAEQVFRRLGIESKLQFTEELLAKLKTPAEVAASEHSIGSHLLMLRLIESISSREMLFRELVAILAQEGQSKKIIVADVRNESLFVAAASSKFTQPEAKSLLDKLAKANSKNNLDKLAAELNLSVFHLRAPNAQAAILFISPASGAMLADGSSLQPLLRVAELGMEVCAFRESTKDAPVLDDSNPLSTRNLMPNFIYSSKPMLDLVNEIQRIRTSDVTTLITGESGSGKELIARAIHIVSRRKDKVFVPFNCTAIPRELVEGTLFGYKKGAFTGADSDSEGLIRSANGGTLFLDEIGDLGLDIQPKILRFLQEGEVQPLGDKAPQTVDVRIVAATNMNLEEKVRQGLFREDLFYRLNVIRLSVPPLRDRRSEIPELVKYFLDTYSTRFGRKNLSVSPEAMSLLVAYGWQGNVRQLCNEVQRMVARAENGDKIGPGHISPEIRSAENGGLTLETNGNVQVFGFTEGVFSVQMEGKTLSQVVSALETQMIGESLQRHDNNVTQVAKDLKLTRRGLYNKLKRYGFRKKDEEEEDKVKGEQVEELEELETLEELEEGDEE
jgi:hydrogenase-4 transcriptional activator